jgi:hypothetical protein
MVINYMLFVKSYFRKKSSKIFIILFALMLFALVFLKSNINKYNILIDESTTNSFIYLETDKQFDASRNDNIKSYYDALHIDVFYYIVNSDLKDNQAIIPSAFDQTKERTIDTNNGTVILDIVGGDEVELSPIIYISEYLFNELKTEYSSGYILYLKSWSKRSEVSKYLKDTYGTTGNSWNASESFSHYDGIIVSYNFYFKIIVVLFIVLMISMIVYITIEYKRNISLYKTFGLKKIKLVEIIIINIILSLLLAIILASIIYLVYIRLFS